MRLRTKITAQGKGAFLLQMKCLRRSTAEGNLCSLCAGMGAGKRKRKMSVINSGLGGRENNLEYPQSGGWGTKLVQQSPSPAIALTTETQEIRTSSSPWESGGNTAPCHQLSSTISSHPLTSQAPSLSSESRPSGNQLLLAVTQHILPEMSKMVNQVLTARTWLYSCYVRAVDLRLWLAPDKVTWTSKWA